MFMLYSIVIGILVGLALGGRPSRLGEIHFKWAWVAVAGLIGQVVLFSAPVTAVVGDLGPPLYVASTLVVLVVVLRNIPNAPGLALVALGAASNLVAIVANGGYMPTTPEAVAAAGLGPTSGYSNSVQSLRPALEALIDRYALPSWVWHANVFSVGDVLIGLGVIVVIVVAMRPKRAPPEGSSNAPTGGHGRPGGTAAGSE